LHRSSTEPVWNATSATSASKFTTGWATCYIGLRVAALHLEKLAASLSSGPKDLLMDHYKVALAALEEELREIDYVAAVFIAPAIEVVKARVVAP
jgi:hypothetical protein